jgi:hypothetical protein
MVIVGFVCIALANSRPYLSPEASELMLKTGMENTAVLLEELGLKNKAVYMPSSMSEGQPQALIPLTDGNDLKALTGKIPHRLIVRYGANPDDMAIAVTTPGNVNLDLLENKPGPDAGDIQTALTYILVGVLDIAGWLKLSLVDSKVEIEVGGAKLHYENIWYYRCLGSPIASIAAAITSEAMGKPVQIMGEEYSKGKDRITLKVLP